MQCLAEGHQPLHILRKIHPPTSPIFFGLGHLVGFLPSSDGLAAYANLARDLSYRHSPIIVHLSLFCHFALVSVSSLAPLWTYWPAFRRSRSSKLRAIHRDASFQTAMAKLTTHITSACGKKSVVLTTTRWFGLNPSMLKYVNTTPPRLQRRNWRSLRNLNYLTHNIFGGPLASLFFATSADHTKRGMMPMLHILTYATGMGRGQGGHHTHVLGLE